MSRRPNVLFLMADQMRAEVLRPDSPCRTPRLDRLAALGTRMDQAYTPNAVCSPARASLMTGLLPHNHGVLWVTHTVDEDQGLLRTDRTHWAQRLADAGYRTGYFGKWHVERTERPDHFGWGTDGSMRGELFRAHAERVRSGAGKPTYSLARYHGGPPGYDESLHYAVTDQRPEERGMGLVTGLAGGWLAEALAGEQPWCCFVSVTEPHDPFVTGEEAYASYDVDGLPLPPSARDDLAGRPAIYNRSARLWRDLTDREMREAMACYYGSVTEIDGLFGRLVDMVEQAGQLQDTIVVVTSDHGELLGAHGMYCKNIMASEEVYNIPLLIAGPGVAAGTVSAARVGLHDLAATLTELTGVPSLPGTDGRSFAEVLADPRRPAPDFRDGYAEYHGGRYLISQRVLWHDHWKYVFNGFDEDELYDLERDPHELHNLAQRPEYEDTAAALMALVWRRMTESGDTSLVNSHYPPLRFAIRGPRPAE